MHTEFKKRTLCSNAKALPFNSSGAEFEHWSDIDYTDCRLTWYFSASPELD